MAVGLKQPVVAVKMPAAWLKLLRNGESRNATVKGHASVYDNENKKQLRCTMTKTCSSAAGESNRWLRGKLLRNG